MNKNIFKIFNWLITALAAFMWINNIVITLKTNPYFGLSIPFQIGAFAGAITVPGIFWLIYYLVYRQKNNNRSKVESLKEGLMNSETIKTDAEKTNDLKNKILELKEIGVLNENETKEKLKEIDDKFERLREQKQQEESKRKIMDSLKILKDENILTNEEYKKIIEELDSNLHKEKPEIRKDERTITLEPEVVFFAHKSNKGVLDIEQTHNSFSDIKRGQKVFMNGAPAPNGKYKLDFMWYVHIKDELILKTTLF